MKYKYPILLLTFGPVSTASAANLILNGDFETGLTGFHNYNVSSELGTFKYGPPSYGSTLPDDWSKNGARNWVVTDNGAAASFDDPDSNYAVRLDGAVNGVNTGNGDIFFQTGINLVAGQDYRFEIDMWSESGSQGADLGALLTGSGLDTITLLDNYIDAVDGVERVGVNFTASQTGSFTLELFNANQLSASSSNHTWIDNVSLEAVPEPTSTSLLGIAGLTLILRRRR
ncbi:hypothetical protein Rhal01_02177 [Rubritalea halochordaticola]|uniref:CBM-cenC domain-containing protein n=1 Tax=Rubritalea halochordaticola TaxID=714537 RepID=A0ABP9V4I9_9BACT